MGHWQDLSTSVSDAKTFHFDQVYRDLSKENLQDFLETKRLLIFREVEKLLLYKDCIDVLDYGSGHGELALSLKNKFGKRVNIWGYEISPCAHTMALKHNSLHHQPVNFFLDESDLFDYTMGHRVFDLIVSRNFFHYTTQPLESFVSFKRVLKDDGMIFIFGDSAPIPIYSNNELKNILEQAGFSQFDVFPFDPLRLAHSSKYYLKHLKNSGSKFYYLAKVLSFVDRPLSLTLFHPLKLYLLRFCDDQSESSGCLVRARA